MKSGEREHSAVGSGLSPFVISEPMYTAMGRLLRACAEIEDIVGLHLGRLGGLTEGQVLVLMGRSSISRKLKAARQFAAAHGGEVLTSHDNCFENPTLRAVILARNVAAHGILLGATDDGRVAFRVESEPKIDTDMVSIATETYEPTAFADFAEIAEDAITQLHEQLKLSNVAVERRAKGLQPHRIAKGN